MWKKSNTKTLTALTTLLFALTTITTTNAYRPGDATCLLSDTNQCPVNELKPSTLDRSVLIYPGGKTRCAFDDYTDPSGNFTTTKTFFFQVFPTEQKRDKHEKKKLLLYFQGGGGCAGADSCSFSVQCSLGKASTFSTSAVASSGGAMNRSNPDNVFQDWDIVSVPYCTGDLHLGGAVHTEPDSAFAMALNQSQCLGKNMTMHMMGHENSLSALKWALVNYPSPEHLVVGGASAGSLAAQVMSALVADMWEVEGSPIRYSVLADSYVGVFPEAEKPAGHILDYFGMCSTDLKLPSATVDACKSETLTFVELISAALAKVPFSDWLFINSTADFIQRYFYELVKDGITGFPFPNLIAGDDYFKRVTSMIDAYRSLSSRVSTFFVEGNKHVFTWFEGYTNAMNDSGEALGDVLAKWLQPHTSATVTPTAAPTLPIRLGCQNE